MQSVTAETDCQVCRTVIEAIVIVCIPFDPVVIDVAAAIVVVVVVVVVIVVTVRVVAVVSVVVVVVEDATVVEVMVVVDERLSCNWHAVVAARRDVGQACL